MKAGWEVKSLGEVCDFVRGPFGGSLKKSCFVESGYAVYEQQHAIYNQFTEIRYFIDKDKFNEMRRFELKPNDLIMSCSGTMGKIAIVPNSAKRGIINQALLKLSTKKHLNIKYLKHWMNSPDFVDRIKENTVGAAIKNVASVKVLKQIPIPIPPLAEQQQIVAILDKAFATIDQAKANIEQNIANAEELFQSKLNTIFSQKGEGWEEKALGEVCENLDSKRIPITKNKRKSGNIPYYGASGVVDYVDDYLFDENLLLVSEDGANLLARTYPIAFSVTGKSWVNNHAHVLKFENMTTQIFIEFYLNSIKLDDYISGMAQPKLNQKKLNSIKIRLPNTKEQKLIVNLVDTLDKKISSINNAYEVELDNLKELKKSLLQKAFAGELTNYATKVIDYPLKIQNISATDLHCGLIALAYQAHEKANRLNTFHHVKTEKIIHLIESHIGIDLERTPIKDAAGPNDFSRVRKKIEPRARKAGYFTVKKIDGVYHYFMGKQSEKLINKVISLLSKEQYQNIHHILGMMTKLDTQQAEIVATLYAAWNNLLLSEKEITDENIVFEARENWHKNKLGIERQRFFNALEWMKREENNLIPNGKGKLVAKKT